MRYVFIANPKAGRSAAGRLSEAVHSRVARHADAGEIAWTSGKGHAERLAIEALEQSRSSQQPLCVVACGGDGTVQEIVNALLRDPHTRGTLAVVPGGRCNDFASAFGICRKAVHLADIILSGQTQFVDIGRVNGRCFCTIAALGFDAAVSRYVNDHWLPLTGTPAYVLGTLRVLLSYVPRETTLYFDGGRFEGPVFLAATANTPCYGGKMRIAPQADPTDGLMEICLVEHMSRWGALKLLGRVLRGRHRAMPHIRFVSTKHLRIESETVQEIWADGEYVTRTPATVELLPGAVEMLVPRCAKGDWVTVVR